MLGLFIGFASDWLQMEEYYNLLGNFFTTLYLILDFVYEESFLYWYNAVLADICSINNISNILINTR